MRVATWKVFLLLIVVFLLGFGCGTDNDDTADDATDGDTSDGDAIDGDNDETDGDEEREPTLADELNITRYAGAITPLEYSSEGNITTYTFDTEEGPICMRGAEYLTGIRDTGSDDLVIFLQGGGACWTTFCLAVTGTVEGVPDIDLLDPAMEGNPVADWNAVYLPYCDGSFFAGDTEYDDNLNNNGKRYHHGLANLTAAMEAAKMRFPNPNRILLAGSSGGAYGLMIAGPLTRHYYPDTELIMMADSGIGLARQGEPEYIQSAIDEFGIGDFLPKDCPDCISDGHIAGVLGYFLERDPSVRLGTYSSWYDYILGYIFLQVPGESFATALKEQTDMLAEKFPDRFKRFIADGEQHTSLLGDPSGIIGKDITAVELPPGALTDLMSFTIDGMNGTEIGGTNMTAWIKALIENDRNVWVDLIEERSAPPDWEWR